MSHSDTDWKMVVELNRDQANATFAALCATIEAMREAVEESKSSEKSLLSHYGELIELLKHFGDAVPEVKQEDDDGKSVLDV